MAGKEQKALAKTGEVVISGKVESAMKTMFAKALRKTGGYNMFPSISMQHGIKKPKFEIEGMDDQDVITGTVIQFESGKEYREDRDEKRPTCSSIGGKYGTKFGKCADCRFGQWREENGKNVKDCKEFKKILMVIEGSDKVFEMKIPGTSLKAFNDFERELATKEKVPYCSAVIELSLGTEVVAGRKPWSVLQFAFKSDARTDEEYFAKVAKGIEDYDGYYVPTSEDDIEAGDNTATASSEEATSEDVITQGDGVDTVDGEIVF